MQKPTKQPQGTMAAAAIMLVCTLGSGAPALAGNTAASKAAVADIARDTGKQTEKALRPKHTESRDDKAQDQEQPAPVPAADPDEPSYY